MATGGGVQSIFQQWKTLDLATLQKELDETAAELANRQDDSESSRKKLVDQSRDFKKNTPEDVRKQVTPLLKSFQAEIDSLSKRSKAAEASFLTLYKKIVEAPDPVPAMEQMMQTHKKAQRCGELELENKNLRVTLDQYNAEFAQVRNQEVTIRQLKERIKLLEEQADSIVEARVAEQETASKRFYDERERQFEEENESLSQKLKEAEERADAVQTSLNAAQNELFVLRSRGDELGSAKASELELILSDVERANQRADTAEKECELLKEKLRNFEHTGHHADGSIDGSDAADDSREKKSGASYQLELSSKEKQIGQLLEELKQANAKFLDSEKRHQTERLELTRELDESQRRIEIMEMSLNAQSDYDEIKRELNVLRSIELGGQDDDGEPENHLFDGIKGSSTDRKASPQKSLEMLLLKKNKALQDENASLRNANRELNAHQAPSPSAALSAMYRDLSDEQLNALITSVSEQRQMDQTIGAPAMDLSDLSDFRHKKDSSRPASGPQLQNVVKRMACLIGTELVTMYQASEEQANMGNKVREKSVKGDAMETRIKDEIPNDSIEATALPASPQEDPAMAAMAMDLLASLRTPTPAGFEEALASGVPREIVEQVALYHLQQSVAKKVREYAAQGEILDTAAVAQRCRVALSTHNIGQRLLAKCILNQSQGSVSELLSKPKPWEKLTEKGKESFRRIQAWLSEESFIELLRMISPKRAYGGFRERYPPKQDEVSTQDKINAILSEAQNPNSKSDLRAASFADICDEMANVSQLARNSGGYSPERQTSTPNSSSAIGGSSSKGIVPGRSSGRYRHDDIPKEMVYEIYRRELEKLQAQDGVDSSTPGDTKPPKLHGGMSNLASSKTLMEPRNAAKRFHSGFASSPSMIARPSMVGARPRPRRLEPKRLSGLGLSFVQRRPQHPSTLSSIIKNNQLFSMRQRSLFANSRRAENRAGMRLPPVRPSWSASRAKFVSPGVIRVDDPASTSPSASTAASLKSPTATMNSEEIPQSFSPGGTPIIGTKAFKAILPPISQEQFEEFSNIDTEDLVKKIKDYLTKYSISQRLFGEQVLGLSQGSVSDLLARPKLWSMLTQKGREPFIRMQLFLSDKKALQKLMEKRQQQAQSQQNGVDGGDGVESMSGDDASNSAASPGSFGLPIQTTTTTTTSAMAPSSASSISSSNRSRRKPILPRASVVDREANRPRELSGIAALLQVAIRGGAGNAASRNRNAPTMAVAPKTSAATTHAPRRYLPPSAIPEPAEPIDTKAVVAQVKSLLLAHNIGQKVFGATVLDMSQGAVSDLLSKTKPWELLSARGREAMIRMKAWLEDTNRLDRIFHGRTPPQAKAPTLKRPAADALLSSTAGFFNDDPSTQPTEAKKARVVLTDEQKDILRSAYDEDSYPSSETVTTLARQLGLSVRTVINWFHNRRMRSKPQPGAVVGGFGDDLEDNGSDGVVDTNGFEGEQYFSYEDELAFAHAELERLATEEDGGGLGDSADSRDSPLHTSGDWTGNDTMENLGWTGDDEDGSEDNFQMRKNDDDDEEEENDDGDFERPSGLEASLGGASVDASDGGESSSVAAKPRLSLLERLEQYVKREDPCWDADEGGRSEAMLRLERSLNNNDDNADWEF